MSHYAHMTAPHLEPLFGLAPADLGDQAIFVVNLNRNQVLFTKGEDSPALFRVISGQVALVGQDNNRIIELLTSGDVFGEEALFGGDRLFHAKMVRAGQIAVLDPKKTSNPHQLIQQVLQRVTERRSRLIEEMADLKSLPPLQRLARLLLTLPEVIAGQPQAQLPWYKVIMAERIGVRPETMSRLLNGLQEHGAQVDGNWVIITDLDALERLGRGDEAQPPRLRKPSKHHNIGEQIC